MRLISPMQNLIGDELQKLTGDELQKLVYYRVWNIKMAPISLEPKISLR